MTKELLVRVIVNISHVDLETLFTLRNCPTDSTSEICSQAVFLKIYKKNESHFSLANFISYGLVICD